MYEPLACIAGIFQIFVPATQKYFLFSNILSFKKCNFLIRSISSKISNNSRDYFYQIWTGSFVLLHWINLLMSGAAGLLNYSGLVQNTMAEEQTGWWLHTYNGISRIWTLLSPSQCLLSEVHPKYMRGSYFCIWQRSLKEMSLWSSIRIRLRTTRPFNVNENYRKHSSKWVQI
jgi:hypothetical protein